MPHQTKPSQMNPEVESTPGRCWVSWSGTIGSDVLTVPRTSVLQLHKQEQIITIIIIYLFMHKGFLEVLEYRLLPGAALSPVWAQASHSFVCLQP